MGFKYPVGSKVYLNYNDKNKEKFSFQPNFQDLGVPFFVHERKNSYYNNGNKYFLKRKNNSAIAWVNEECLSLENNWKNPLSKGGIPILKEVSKLKLEINNGHDGHYVFYKERDAVMETYKFLNDYAQEFYYDDDEEYCDNCYDGDCDNCTARDEYYSNSISSSGVKGFKCMINNEPSCWGDMGDCYTEFVNRFSIHPSHIAVLINYNSDLTLKDESLFGRIFPAPVPFDELIQYYYAMQEIGAIPKSINLAELKSGENIVLKVPLENLSSEHMYAQVCTLRLPIQFPGIVRATVFFVNRGVDPLMAYVMAHANVPLFNGGHAVFDPKELIEFLSDNNGEIRYNIPNVENMATTAVRYYVFLNNKKRIAPTIKEDYEIYHYMRMWSMYELIHNWKDNSPAHKPTHKHAFEINFTPKNKGIDLYNFHRFDPKTRKLRKE